MKRDIFKPRLTFKPFEYPELEDFMKPIQATYWVHDEVNFDRDVQDFHTELNDSERKIIGTILKTFAMTEVFVADEFWGVISNYLPKPEIGMIASTFTENEWRHANAYHRMNEVLGLQDFDAFLEDEVAMAKFNNLTKVGKDHNGNPSKKDVARTLAIFGAFTENVCLFSQFAILRSFSNNGRSVLNNIGDIIDWSQLDEQQHAKVAMWLFNKIREENPDIWTDEFKNDIYTAARITFDLEVNLINQIFEVGDLPNLRKSDLINYMKYRVNLSLKTIGLKPVFEVNNDQLKELDWFEDKFKLHSHKDFFAKRVTDYSKSLVQFDADTVFVSREEVENHIKV
jgi:ribonucleoside-diphosphate reductase beta chain